MYIYWNVQPCWNEKRMTTFSIVIFHEAVKLLVHFYGILWFSAGNVNFEVKQTVQGSLHAFEHRYEPLVPRCAWSRRGSTIKYGIYFCNWEIRDGLIIRRLCHQKIIDETRQFFSLQYSIKIVDGSSIGWPSSDSQSDSQLFVPGWAEQSCSTAEPDSKVLSVNESVDTLLLISLYFFLELSFN